MVVDPNSLNDADNPNDADGSNVPDAQPTTSSYDSAWDEPMPSADQLDTLIFAEREPEDVIEFEFEVDEESRIKDN